MKTYPIIIKATNYTIEITQPPGDFVFPSKEERERWTAALRSGTYKQGRGCLSVEIGSYCCLGVLQFLYENRQPTPVQHQKAHYLWGHSDFPPNYQAPWERGVLPTGVTVENKKNHVFHTLSAMNDSGMSFADIADIIDIVYNPDTY